MTSDLAVEAARAALEVAGISADQLDLIVCASVTGDTPFPATAVWIQRKLGIGCPAFDVNAACAGFSYALATATAFVETGMAETVLLVGAEVFSRILDFTDRGTCILFGDGAGAAIVQAAQAPGVIGTVLGADGSAAEILLVPGGGSRRPASAESVAAGDHYLRMPNGREVFKRAVTEMAASCRELLEKSGYTADDVDILIPHQANARIMTAVGERLGIGADRAVVDVAEVGNTSAASIPIALDRAWRAGRGSTRATWSCSRRSGRPHLGRHPRALDDAGAGPHERPRSPSSPAHRVVSAARARSLLPRPAGPSRSATGPTRPPRKRCWMRLRPPARPGSPSSSTRRMRPRFRRLSGALPVRSAT